MRRALYVVLLSSLAFNFWAAYSLWRHLNAVPEAIAGRGNVLEMAPVRKCDVLIIGDSFVMGCPWSEYLGRSVLERGVSGDTTEGVISRLSEARRHQPRVLVVFAGTNDLVNGESPLNVAHRLIQIARSRIAPKVFVFGLLPMAREWQHLNASSSRVNEMLASECATGHAIYIAPPADYDPRTMTYDGMHPNGMGYRLITQNLASRL